MVVAGLEGFEKVGRQRGCIRLLKRSNFWLKCILGGVMGTSQIGRPRSP